MFRTALVASLALVLLGCAEDDPFVTVTQAPTTLPSEDVDAEPDEPAPDEPSEADPLADFPRPADLVDLRGLPTVEIEVTENIFDYRHFRVDPGTAIVFVNRGSDAHNVKPAIADAFPSIDKDLLWEEPQALVLTEPGDYPFYCSLHGTSRRGQTGYVVVGDG